MDQIIRIGMDTSKSVFQVEGVGAGDVPVLRKKLNRSQIVPFFQKLPPTKVGLEACGASHHWGRVLEGLGHEVVLIPPQYVKPYLKRGKNDANDAAAICEAMSRPTMRFVPVKTAEQQGDLMLVTVRELLIRQRTQLSNAIRGHATEFGVTRARGLCQMPELFRLIADHDAVPTTAREMFTLLEAQFDDLERRIAEISRRLEAWHKSSPVSRNLATIPGVGKVTAALLAMKIPDPHVFKSGRHMAAWVGLTPKDHSTAGRQRQGGITKAGDDALRQALVLGATVVVMHARGGRLRRSQPWLTGVIARKPPKVAAVALANKTARIAWKMMITGEAYRGTPNKKDSDKLGPERLAA